MMKEIFFQILDMSISASILAGVVILLRLVLRKAPKAIHCALWAMVALRLICPALPESQVSLMPAAQPVSSVVLSEPQKTPVTNSQPQVQAPQASVPNNTVTAPKDQEKAVDWASILTGVWLAGVGLMALYGFGSYLFLRRKVSPAVQEDGVWLCDEVASPFILGIFRPRIYLPSALDEGCRESVMAHERAHIRRKDHWWKPLGFVLLAVHWFNPVMWLAYVLLCRDIEAACDERVVKKMDSQERKRYSEALLSCAAPRRSIAACPLAFGEQGIKGRIKSVLNYKKPTIWIILVAVLASVAVGVFFLTNSPKDQDKGVIEYSVPAHSKKVVATSTKSLKEKAPEYFGLNGENGFEIFVWEEQKYLWCGIMEIGDDPKTQKEVDELVAISMSNMEIILRENRTTKTTLHLIGRFESLEEIGGRNLSEDTIKMWLNEQWMLGGFSMRGGTYLRFVGTTGEDCHTYIATGETIGKEQLGLLLTEGATAPTCVINEISDQPKYAVYTIMDKDATYLAAGEVRENMVYQIYKKCE